MTALRAFLLSHRIVAIWAILAAMVLKAAIPAGFMVSADDGSRVLTVTVCNASSPELATLAITIPGTGEKRDHRGGDHKQASGDCAFTSLVTGKWAAADPVLVIAALAFVAALAMRPVQRVPPAQVPYPRPRSRAPPLTV